MYSDKHERFRPLPYFMDKVFEELKVKKGGEYPNLPHDTIFQGFKTIHIQQLEPKNAIQPQNINGKGRWHKDLVNNVLCYEQSCSMNMASQNGFFDAFYQAYINHGDVKITPDDVWATILVYFSKYVDDRAQQLRKAFVNHQGKKQLIIETQEQKQETEWNQFFQKVLIQIRKNTVEGVTQQLESNFTTTDRFFTLFSTATIMNSFKKYFDYTRMMCACGIQNIHMGGTLQDWQKLSQKLLNLKQFDVDGKLKSYINGLEPILQQFIQTYKGRPHLQFWNNIYQERINPHKSIYQASMYRNGWIIKFFTNDQCLADSVPIQQIDVPIKIINEITNTTKMVNLVGGSRGVSIEAGTIYRPHFSFAIVEKGHKRKNKSRGLFGCFDSDDE